MKSLDSGSWENEIKQNLEELEEAENRKSIEEMLELVTEDFVFIYHDTTVEGKMNVREMLKESIKGFISSKHVPLRIEVSSSGDMAWVIGYELNQRARNNGIVNTKQFYILTFRQEDGKWKQAAVCVA